MSETRDRLRTLGLPHGRARAVAAALRTLGAALGIAALGVALAPRPFAIGAGWLGIAVVALWSVRQIQRAARSAEPEALAPLVEERAGGRSGSLSGVLWAGRGGSAALLSLADRRAAETVTAAAPTVRRLLWSETRGRVARAVLVAALGAGALMLASPRRSSAFWHPLRATLDARAPVRLEVDRDHVRRGESIEATILAPGSATAILWVRGAGESWRAISVALDSGARGARRLGPLDADLFLRATSGSRTSAERRVTVSLPAFLAALDITARFPRYLERADEPLTPSPDTVPLAAGTVVSTAGAASVALSRAAWVRSQPGHDEIVLLVATGPRFEGRFAPRVSGTWRLELRAADGGRLEGEAPELQVRVVPDSAPVVFVPVPGRDATLPLSLRQPLVIDAHDDHAITRVEIVSWRVSQTGKVGEPVHEVLTIGSPSDRVLLESELDATRRGLLPGDTLRLRAVAWDNAPVPQEGRSPEIALLLPSLAELRAATRAASRDFGDSVSTLAQAAAALADHTRDLAAQSPRGTPRSANTQPGALPFDASQRAAAVTHEEAELEARAEQLARAVAQLARAAEAAGLGDTAFQARLEEVRRLLQQALTPELSERLRELQAAVARLDPEATAKALQQLAEAEQRFREALERSRALFQRAAVEGSLASLAADAEELDHRQRHWNEADGRRPDSAAATRERLLAAGADSLAQGISRAARDLGVAGASPDVPSLDLPMAEAERARTAMRGAAGAADRADASGAVRDGGTADSALADIPELLRRRRDSLAGAWRRETLEALDRALGETVDLAGREQAVVDSLRHGDSGPGLRARQASVEAGTGAIIDQIRAAAGRHALVSPQLEGVVGFAERQMAAAGAELEEATPNVDAAAAFCEQSVDALNTAAYALVRTRNDVATARSGTGFAEALAQLARLAQQQGALNAQAQGLLPLAIGEGAALRDQMRALAAGQRALADQLERLRASGGSEAAGALGQEARDLAAQLEAGRLDARTVLRQERLYHRLLDAGRTLANPEPDQDRERVSRAASGDSIHVPPSLRPGVTGAGPRLRYPSWDELRTLTPDERRLVLEYFQRLNAPLAR